MLPRNAADLRVIIGGDCRLSMARKTYVRDQIIGMLREAVYSWHNRDIPQQIKDGRLSGRSGASCDLI